MQENFICQYCGREHKNLNSLRQHEIRCKENPNRIDLSYIKPGHSKGHKGVNQFTKAKRLGLPKPCVSQETREKISKVWRGRHHTNESKQKISKGIRKAIKEHPESYLSMNVNGRVKHYEYNGVTLDGLWELDVAKYLDKNQIQWERPKTGFEYEWNNSKHLYFPDFYLPEYNFYIEVKGYQRDRDIQKWKVIDYLIVLKQREIEAIRRNEYNIFNYFGDAAELEDRERL